MDMIMKEVIKVIGQKVMRRKKSPRLYHSSASVLLMRTTVPTSFGKGGYSSLFMNKINQ
jgi:hypothetical protein